MTLVLHRFDDAERFPLLDTLTTARGPWTVRLRRVEGETELCVTGRRTGGDPPGACVCLGLPIRAVAGHLRRLGLEARGDGSGCGLYVEASDARGCGFRYGFGTVSFADVRTCWAEADDPIDYWEGSPPPSAPQVTPPVQFLRLTIVPAHGTDHTVVALRQFLVTGDVRLASPGIA